MKKQTKVVLMSLVALVIFVIYAINYTDKRYEKAEEKSLKTVNALIDSYEHNAIISDSNDPDEVVKEFRKNLGKYLTNEYEEELETYIRHAMNTDKNYNQAPKTIGFFLVYDGESLRFSKPENPRRTYWITVENEIIGTDISMLIHPDNPGWEQEYGEFAVVFVKKTWWNFKIDGLAD